MLLSFLVIGSERVLARQVFSIGMKPYLAQASRRSFSVTYQHKSKNSTMWTNGNTVVVWEGKPSRSDLKNYLLGCNPGWDECRIMNVVEQGAKPVATRRFSVKYQQKTGKSETWTNGNTVVVWEGKPSNKALKDYLLGRNPGWSACRITGVTEMK